MAKQTTTGDALELGDGVVAVVDALGFKAARDNFGVERLVKSVRSSRAIASHVAGLLKGGGETHVAAFSDSIIAARMNTEESPAGMSMLHVAVSCCAVMSSTRVAEAPLAYRGCISAGELLAIDDIFVGRAIDDAAAWYERADVAAVWLTPSAALTVKNLLPGSRSLMLPWGIPIKGAGVFETLTVNPFYLTTLFCARKGTSAESDVRELRNALLAPFDGSSAIDVAIKRQNTAAFLDAAAGAATDSEVEMRAFVTGVVARAQPKQTRPRKTKGRAK